MEIVETKTLSQKNTNVMTYLTNLITICISIFFSLMIVEFYLRSSKEIDFFYASLQEYPEIASDG
ncbi:MAG: hypothetical protein HQK77_04505 [Desulfobacterales bacterium]|nr:hypothetical protein [Desulfobacterales bacterium]